MPAWPLPPASGVDKVMAAAGAARLQREPHDAERGVGEQHLVQRGKGRPVVRAADIIEPGAALSHVPLGHVIVHELHDATRRRRGVVRCQRRIHVLLHTRET